MSQSLRGAIGVDLGGTKIELGLVDHEGRLHGSRRIKTGVDQGPSAIQTRLIAAIRALQREAEIPLVGIGIGAAGQIEPGTGEVLFAPNLRWHRVPLRANLEEALKISVRVMNDVRAITLGEWLYGAGRGCRDLLCIFVGTGIGGGVVSGGRLLTGGSNTFGEVGHMTVDFKGPLCSCGKLGCVEVYASGWGMVARAQEAIRSDPEGDEARALIESAKGQAAHLTSRMIAQKARKGNKMAREVIEEGKRALVAGMASWVNLFNPSRLIVGGGLVEGMPELMEAVVLGVPSEALRSATENLLVIRAELGEKAGVIGAAASLFER